MRIFLKECRSLAHAGYDTHLIAHAPADTERDGVQLRTLGPRKGRLARMLLSSGAALRMADQVGADLYHFHDPELIRVGLALKKRGKVVVYDVHESHAESVLDRAYIPAPLRRVVSARVASAERAADKRLDAIVAATPKIAASFSNPNTVLVQNFPMLEELASPESEPFQSRPQQVVYVGGVSLVRGAKEMVASLRRSAGTTFIVIGEPAGDLPLIEWVDPSLSERVKLLGWQPRDEVSRLMSQCRAGFVLYHPLRNHTESQPNKLFEYMAAGLPVIASDFPHWRSLVDEFGCGVLVDPLDPVAIGDTLDAMMTNPVQAEEMGKRGRQAVIDVFNWSTQEQVLLDLYRRLLGC
ncbi:MAG: glycosyltransferase family 4 protein [Armatimonadetes bacterium]|nr:glycosyltransferase family 4 protein [Armatimonadota bacterium]